ncbi:MAG: vWA domain-containing protein, partial [Acidimicrobiales bacterium]
PQAFGTLLVHHVGHLLRDHAGRARDRAVGQDEGRRWTAAADAEINDDLVAAGLALRATDITPGRLGQPDSRLAEQYYDEMGEPPACPDHGSGADGVARSWDGESGSAAAVGQSEAEAIRMRVAHDILTASRAAGEVPGGWVRWAIERSGSAVDWRRLLASELRSGVAAVAGLVDYTYRRPSRRAGSAGPVVLPAMERPLPRIAIVVDSSGSISEDDLGSILGEVDGILRRLGLREATVLAVDTEVHEVRRVRRAAEVQLAGGGGTDLRPGIEAAARLRPRPDLIVVLTDGYTPWPDRGPAGISVVVGLIGVDQGQVGPPTPAWSKAVAIPPA